MSQNNTRPAGVAAAIEPSNEILLIHPQTGAMKPKSRDEIWTLLNEHGVSPTPYESIVEARWFEDLKFCGCGYPEETRAYLLGILKAIKQRSDSDWKEDTIDQAINNPEMFRYFMLYVLDAMGLTEHGSNVGGSWLTEKGIAFVKEMEE